MSVKVQRSGFKGSWFKGSRVQGFRVQSCQRRRGVGTAGGAGVADDSRELDPDVDDVAAAGSLPSSSARDATRSGPGRSSPPERRGRGGFAGVQQVNAARHPLLAAGLPCNRGLSREPREASREKASREKRAAKSEPRKASREKRTSVTLSTPSILGSRRESRDRRP